MISGPSKPLLALVLAALLPVTAHAQGGAVAFGGLKGDSTLPVEVTSDTLTVRQPDGEAVFEGNVIVIQGDLRMTAPEVRVYYVEGDTTEIERVHALRGVTIVSPTEAAEGKEAVYTIAKGEVVMTGDVLLTQGTSTINGQKMVIDLNTGKGVMEGRVKTVLTPGAN